MIAQSGNILPKVLKSYETTICCWNIRCMKGWDKSYRLMTRNTPPLKLNFPSALSCQHIPTPRNATRLIHTRKTMDTQVFLGFFHLFPRSWWRFHRRIQRMEVLVHLIDTCSQSKSETEGFWNENCSQSKSWRRKHEVNKVNVEGKGPKTQQTRDTHEIHNWGLWRTVLNHTVRRLPCLNHRWVKFWSFSQGTIAHFPNKHVTNSHLNKTLRPHTKPREHEKVHAQVTNVEPINGPSSAHWKDTWWASVLGQEDGKFPERLKSIPIKTVDLQWKMTWHKYKCVSIRETCCIVCKGRLIYFIHLNSFRNFPLKIMLSAPGTLKWFSSPDLVDVALPAASAGGCNSLGPNKAQ